MCLQVCEYLLNTSKLLSQEEAWERSLELEPRNPHQIKRNKDQKELIE